MKNILLISVLCLILLGCTGNAYNELQLASARGQTDVIGTMLDNGADVNAPNKHGKTPLMLAAGNGRVDTVKLLLSRNAIISARDIDGMTALMMASSSGEAAVAEVLVAHGADINVTNNYNASAITNAAFFNKVATLEALLKSDIKVDPEIGESSLLIAAGLGNDEVIIRLLNYGINVNATGKKGRTPLMAAVEFNHPSTVKLLLESKADAKVRDSEGNSVMQIAEDEGDNSIIQLLKDFGG